MCHTCVFGLPIPETGYKTLGNAALIEEAAQLAVRMQQHTHGEDSSLRAHDEREDSAGGVETVLAEITSGSGTATKQALVEFLQTVSAVRS